MFTAACVREFLHLCMLVEKRKGEEVKGRERERERERQTE